jgi:hypothetical protein
LARRHGYTVDLAEELGYDPIGISSQSAMVEACVPTMAS